jgi:putative NADH-flavin reductase
MLIVVLGSTGRVGSLVVREAASRGWDVRAADRRPSRLADTPRVTSWPIDLEDPASLDAALRDADAVVGCLGPRANRPAEVEAFEAMAGRLSTAMQRSRVRRLVLLSGAGVRVSGERRGTFDRLMASLAGRAARHVVAAKQVEHDTIAASDLDWTALRPGLVVDGPRTGRYELGESAPGARARIRRADVAVALVDQVIDATWTRRSPFLWTPR